MEDILDFILEKHNLIDKDKQISIKISRNKLENISDLKFSKNEIIHLLDNLKNTSFIIRKAYENYRLYKVNNLEYKITRNKEQAFSKDYLDFLRKIEGDIELNILFEENKEISLGDFPSLMEYHDIINRNVLKLFINNILEIHITNDSSCHLSYMTLSIVLNKQNIYQDKVKEIMRKVLKIITKHLNNNNLTINSNKDDNN